MGMGLDTHNTLTCDEIQSVNKYLLQTYNSSSKTCSAEDYI